MIPYAFKYRRPESVAEAQAMFAQSRDAKYLAGAQTLIPAMKQRLANPAELIDLSALVELKRIALRGNAVILGAGMAHGDVAESPEIRRRIPALSQLAGMIGDPAVRHRGTLGGSLANSDPAADYPAAVLGLGATIQTTKRSIAADAFFLGMFQTALEDGEIITEVAFPIPRLAAYAKFPNPASRYATVGVFVAGFADRARVAVTGAGPFAFRVGAMEGTLSRRFHPEALARISIPSDGLNSDLHASAEYRSHLVTVVAKRAAASALHSAHEGESSP